MGIVQLKIKEVVLKMSNLFAISLLLVSLHYLVFSVSGESNCEAGYKSCEHKDHGNICIPDDETCSRNKRSATATTCPNGEQNNDGSCRKHVKRSTSKCPPSQLLRDGMCQDIVDVPKRKGHSAVQQQGHLAVLQPGLLLGSRPCRNECTFEDKKGDKEGRSWCTFGTPENWGWCDYPYSGEKQSGSRPCVFPFKYNGVVYNECTDIQWSNKWCATATNWRDEYIGAWGDCQLVTRDCTLDVISL